jgi:hypothetical protein
MNTTAPYSVSLFNDLHTYFPDILYNPDRFRTVSQLLQYISRQAQYHGNTFNRNQTTYNTISPPESRLLNPPSIIRTQPPRIIAETIIAPSILQEPDTSIQFPAPSMSTSTAISNLLLTELLNYITPPRTTRFQDPVPVIPTPQQIETATTLEQASQDEEYVQCTICQDMYTEGQAIRTIHHCHHSFHKTCIDSWFQSNTRCPICRYDIREYTSSS